jgi:hypothetical protein
MLKEEQKMTTSNIVEKIVKHPAVSRVYQNDAKITNLTDNPGLQALCRLRRQRRDAKRGIQNAREEFAAYGARRDWYERGLNYAPGRVPAGEKLLRLAAEHRSELPEDLTALIDEALNTR